MTSQRPAAVPVVLRHEVEPLAPAVARGRVPGDVGTGLLVAVLVSLNFPQLTPTVADLVRRFTRTALSTVTGNGAEYELFDTSARGLGDPHEIARFDGLLVLGGGDVDGSLYGFHGAAANSYGVDRRADEYTVRAIRAAVAAQRPVLGICRGSQLVNVAYGGTLVPDLQDYRLHRGGPGQPMFLDEKVTVVDGSRLHGLLGQTRLTVRSGHHQAVETVGAGLSAVAAADDGVVEAIEHPDRWVVGVQWHPEDPDGCRHDRERLFRGFLRACSPSACGAPPS